MPFEIISLGRGKYEVKNSETGTIHSKHTTKKNAMAQVRLLNEVSKGEGMPTGSASDFVKREKEATNKTTKRDLNKKLKEISEQQQENFIKNEQMRIKPQVELSHLAKPVGTSVAPDFKKVHGRAIGITDHHIAKMGL
jgi:hypothetical protein